MSSLGSYVSTYSPSFRIGTAVPISSFSRLQISCSPSLICCSPFRKASCDSLVDTLSVLENIGASNVNAERPMMTATIAHMNLRDLNATCLEFEEVSDCMFAFILLITDN